MDYLYDLKDMLCDELEEIAKKAELNAGDLETVHKLTDTIKNIDKIDMLEDEDGYSGDRRMSPYDGRRERGYSMRRRRDSRGRYSRDSAKDSMMEHLERMMDEAETEKERQAIRRCMEQLEKE